MRVFVGHSFDVQDEPLVLRITNFLTKHKVQWESGEVAQNNSIALKVRGLIDRNPIFIGIFTRGRKIEVAPQGCLEKVVAFLKRNKESSFFTTSNWVIQESGYALGAGRKTIFLVEEGIYKFPNLQGDAEVVLFNRENIDAALVRLMEMLLSVGSIDLSQVDVVQQGGAEKLLKNEAGEKLMAEEGKTKGTSVQKFFELLNKKDFDGAEGPLRDVMQDGESKEWALLLESLLLRKRYCAGHRASLQKLEELFSKTKDSDVGVQLGLSHDAFGKGEDARRAYRDALQVAKNISEKVSCEIKIAESYSQEGQLQDAVNALLKALSSVEFRDDKEATLQILTSLVSVTEKKDDYLYFVFAEKLLDLNPVEIDIRFNLAYKYSNTDKEDLAAYHYKKLLDVMDYPMAFNNIGVAYDALGIKAKAIEYYQKARGLKITLAHSNLANKYLEEGFVTIAESLLKEADEFSKEDIEVHPNVGLSKKRLKELLKQEDVKESELLKAVEKVRDFKVLHADAVCFESAPIDIFGVLDLGEWRTVKVAFDASIGGFLGTGTFEEEMPSPLGLSGFSAFGQAQQKQVKKFTVELKIFLRNRGGHYSLIVRDEALGPRRLLSFNDERHNAKGLVILTEDNRFINVLEEGKDKKFLQWERVV